MSLIQPTEDVMDFTNEQLTDSNEYVADNNLHDYINVHASLIQMKSECGRFVASIKPANIEASAGDGLAFCVMIEDVEPAERELGFSYGLPFTVTLDDTWSTREVLSYIRSLLHDIVCASVRLRTAIRSVRELSMSCFEINRAYSQMGVGKIKVAESVAIISAQAALGKVVNISVEEYVNRKRKNKYTASFGYTTSKGDWNFPEMDDD